MNHLICRSCRARLTSEVDELSQPRLVGVPPAHASRLPEPGSYYRWRDDDWRDRFGDLDEPSREGALVLHAADVPAFTGWVSGAPEEACGVQVAGSRVTCPSGHDVGRRFGDGDGSVAFSADAVVLV